MLEELPSSARSRAASVAIVIPCYNAGSYVKEAVDSALNQTVQAGQIIVVNDGSSDRETLDALAGLAEDERVTILNQPNRGVSAARNTGIAAASSAELILPLDADDRLTPETVEKLSSEFEDLSIGIATGAQDRFIDGAACHETRPSQFTGLPSMLRDNVIPDTAMFRREDWELVSGYPEELSQGEDWAFWMRILRLGRNVSVKEFATHEYRLWPKQATQNISPVSLAAAQNLVLEENHDLYAAHPEVLIEQLLTTRHLLAEYRQAYRYADALKIRAKNIVSFFRSATQRIQPRE